MKNGIKPMNADAALELIAREVRQTNNGKLLLANLPAVLRGAVDGLVACGKLSRAKFLEFGDSIEIGRECVIRQLDDQRYGVFYVRKGRDEDCVGDYTGPLARIHAVEYAETLGYRSAQVVELDQKTKKLTEVPAVSVKAQYMDLMITLQDGWAIIHGRANDDLKNRWGQLLRECGDFAEKPPVISPALNARIYRVLDEGKSHFVGNVFLSTSLQSRYVRVLREHASLMASQTMDGSLSNGVAVAAADLERVFGEEHPEFDREAHSHEVSCGDTRLWEYWEWVVHQVEADGRAIEDEVARQANCRCG